MSESRNIIIDLDVHRAIEAGRRSFSETENDILRRLLLGADGTQLDSASRRSNSESVPGPPILGTLESEWSWKGVALPHGTLLRMDYNGETFDGVVNDGRWIIDGVEYRTPSDAAGGAVERRRGTRPSLNGWIYWKALKPGTRQWTPLQGLRRK